jgi:membrane protein YqaA with SNARE-associated domain
MSTLIGFLTNWIIGLAFKKKQEEVNEALEKEAEKIQRKAIRRAK